MKFYTDSARFITNELRLGRTYNRNNFKADIEKAHR